MVTSCKHLHISVERLQHVSHHTSAPPGRLDRQPVRLSCSVDRCRQSLGSMAHLVERGQCQVLAYQQPLLRCRDKQFRPIRQLSRGNHLHALKNQSRAQKTETASRTRKRNTTINDGTQLAGPGAWGKQVNLQAVCHTQPGQHIHHLQFHKCHIPVNRQMAAQYWWLTLGAPIVDLSFGSLT